MIGEPDSRVTAGPTRLWLALVLFAVALGVATGACGAKDSTGSTLTDGAGPGDEPGAGGAGARPGVGRVTVGKDAGNSTVPPRNDAGSVTSGPTDAPAIQPPKDASVAVITPDAAKPIDNLEPTPSVNGCEIVDCGGLGDCCRIWYSYAIDTPARDRVSNKDLVVSLKRTTAEVESTFQMTDPLQYGAVYLSLKTPAAVATALASVLVTGDADPAQIGISSGVNASGCWYNVLATGAADRDNPSCFGESPTSPADQIVIRAVARRAGKLVITVKRLALIAP